MGRWVQWLGERFGWELKLAALCLLCFVFRVLRPAEAEIAAPAAG
jgi:hypothetical protein